MNLVLRKWGVILAEGLIAILAGGMIAINIFNSWSVMVYFGLFIFINAILMLSSGTRWSLILQGVAGILVSLLLILVLGLAEWNTPLNEIRLGYLSTYIGFWAITSGFFQVITALYLRMPLQKAWMYGTAGLLTLGFGLVKLALPASNLIFLAVYAIIYGVLLVIFALKLRGWLRSTQTAVEVSAEESTVTEGSAADSSTPREAPVQSLADTRQELSRWWAFLIRGLLALTFAIGSSLIMGFQTSVAGVFILFSLFLLLSGIFGILAVSSWTYKLTGVAGIIAGTFIFFMTVAILLSLDMFWSEDLTVRILRYISVWAILAGLLEGVTAIWLRKRFHGEWLMAASGGITLILGGALLAIPTLGVIPLMVYAFLYAALQIALGFRLASWTKRHPLPADAVN